MIKKQILLIEADDGIRLYYSSVFAETDYEIIFVTGWSNAIDMLRSGRKIDLIICDILTPVEKGMDGAEFFWSVRREMKSKIPFLSYTTIDDSLVVSDSAQSQTSSVFGKTIMPDQMKEMIKEIFERSAKKRILIMEEHAIISRQIKELPGANEYEIEITKDTNMCLKKARICKPNLVILSVGDGTYTNTALSTSLRLCRILKFDSAYADVPVVIIAHNRDKDLQKDAYAVGADTFLTHSQCPKSLFESVNKLLL